MYEAAWGDEINQFVLTWSMGAGRLWVDLSFFGELKATGFEKFLRI